MNRRRAATVLVVWMAVVGVMATLDMRPAIVAIGAIAAAVAAVVAVTFDLGEVPVPVDWTAVREGGPSGRGADPRVRALRRQLVDERRLDTTTLHHALVDLVDDRLLAHHRVDRHTDAAAAHALLSPALRDLVAGPGDRQLADPRRLDRILTDLEAL